MDGKTPDVTVVVRQETVDGESIEVAVGTTSEVKGNDVLGVKDGVRQGVVDGSWTGDVVGTTSEVSGGGTLELKVGVGQGVVEGTWTEVMAWLVGGSTLEVGHSDGQCVERGGGTAEEVVGDGIGS